MEFSVVNNAPTEGQKTQSKGYLVRDNWDDWGKYQTAFDVIIYDHDGNRHELGPVKIGQIGLKPGSRTQKEPGVVRSPNVPATFKALDDSFFSLGQGDNYYEHLNQIEEHLRLSILVALRDVAYDWNIFQSVKDEEVTTESLLRGIPISNLKNRLRRLASGDATLTEFEFTLALQSHDENANPPEIAFSVHPHSLPPTNVHVVIGRNGVGKTTTLRRIISQLTTPSSESSDEAVSPQSKASEDWDFSGLVVVTFSVFDSFFEFDLDRSPIPATFVSAFEKDQSSDFRIKTKPELAKDFSNSLASCRKGLRRERWIQSVRLLQNDPLFAEVQVDELINLSERKWKKKAESVFADLSAGHSVVLLTITRLVQLVHERTLVLIDEPESHLHPPLLSAFVRSLSALLVRRNGVSIIATHSPVVLQEVPRTCAWILQRSGIAVSADRPEFETFGENVGVLTHGVFGLEVTNTGFYSMLNDAFLKNPSYESALEEFEGELGSEGRAILRSLFASKGGSK